MSDDRTDSNVTDGQAEECPDDSPGLYQYFFENFPGIVFLADQYMKPVFIQGKLESITGYTQGDLLSGDIKWTDIIHPDDLGNITEATGDGPFFSSPGTSQEREHRIIRKDGEIRWIREIETAVVGKDGNVRYIQFTVFDITLRKETAQRIEAEYQESLETSLELRTAYEEMRKSQENLVKSEKTARIGTLAEGVAHEINNPLQVIYGMTEIIMEEEDISEVKKYCGDILDAAERIKRIVHGLAYYSSEILAKAVEWIDLNEIIEDGIEMLKHSPKLYDVHLRVQLNEIPEIEGNREELQQVIINILHNALGAMEGDGELSIYSYETDNFIVIEIKDTGKGISNDKLESIFVPFFTTEGFGARTGLGLYIVHKIIKKYEGTIEIESREGKGTTVTLKFPIYK